MTARRALGLLLVAAAAAVALHAARSALPAPPLSEPPRLDDWWADGGTATAVLALARIGGLAFCGYLSLIGLLGTVAAMTRWRWTLTVTMWAATPALRRMFAGGSLALALTSGSAAAAAAPAPYSIIDIGEVQGTRAESTRLAPGDPATTSARRAHHSVTDLGAVPIPSGHHTVTDIGAAPTAPKGFFLTDLGAALTGLSARQAESAPRPAARVDKASPDPHSSAPLAGSRHRPHTANGNATDNTKPNGHTANGNATDNAEPNGHTATGNATGDTPEAGTSDSWLVERGDHLWGIAVATVAERSGSGDHMAVLRYWLRLIEANADTVGDNPDLIYPGQVMRLPR